VVIALPVLWNIICTLGLFSKIEKNNPDISKNGKNTPDSCWG
jgi:hypothetical protein